MAFPSAYQVFHALFVPAQAYYKQAQQHRRLGSGARLRTSAPSSSSSGDTTAAEAELKLKEGKVSSSQAAA